MWQATLPPPWRGLSGAPSSASKRYTVTAMPDNTNDNLSISSAPDSAWASIFDSLKTIGFVLIVAFFIRQFLIQPFVVDGMSMEPNFLNTEYILVDKVSYRFTPPSRGDVIVFHPPGQQDNFIKRIIGLPGEHVQVVGHTIFINNQELIEPYLRTAEQEGSTSDITRPFDRILEMDEYFVLGDNRDHSRDSREIGPITKDRVIGRARLILFPLNKMAVITPPNYPIYASTSFTSFGHLPTTKQVSQPI